MVAGPAGGLTFSPNLILALIFGAVAGIAAVMGAFLIKHWAVWLTATLCAIIALAEFAGMLYSI
jgi:hypothetical protein